MIINCLYDKLVPISELIPHDKNRNKHPADQIARLAKILLYQGWRYPIKVSKRSNKITSGHGRIEAAKFNNWKEVPVNFQDYESEEQEYADLQADNAIASWAELDLSMINADIGELGPDFDIDLLGIKDFEIEPADKLEPGCDEDEVPEKVEPKTKPGDLYILGNHRLLCGDSTNIQHVERLMGGSRAQITFTSPPYNLGDNFALRAKDGKGKKSAYIEKSDHKTQDEYLDFLRSFTSISMIVSDTQFINIQLLAGNKQSLPQYWNELREYLCDLLIWDKEHAAPAMAARVLNSVFEMVFVFSSEKHPSRSMRFAPEFHGNIQNIFRLNPVGKKDELAKDHGAVFPVAFPEYFITKFSTGDVYEPFSGSGTTIIACEKTNRKCYGMELDPHYCDVIVARWEKYTSKKAELVNG